MIIGTAGFTAMQMAALIFGRAEILGTVQFLISGWGSVHEHLPFMPVLPWVLSTRPVWDCGLPISWDGGWGLSGSAVLREFYGVSGIGMLMHASSTNRDGVPLPLG